MTGDIEVDTSGEAEPKIECWAEREGQSRTVEGEKFPILQQQHKRAIQKSKSLTAAEMSVEVMSEEDVATVAQSLRDEESPLSLSEARDRRASIKQERRDSINLIRSRTASRASNSGQPSLEDIAKDTHRTGLDLAVQK